MSLYKHGTPEVHKLPGQYFLQRSRAIFFKLPPTRYRLAVVVRCRSSHPAPFVILVIKGPRFPSASSYDARTRIGGGTYNNGRTSFIGAAVTIRRSSRIRANKVALAYSRISAETKLHSASSRPLCAQDFPFERTSTLLASVECGPRERRDRKEREKEKDR